MTDKPSPEPEAIERAAIRVLADDPLPRRPTVMRSLAVQLTLAIAVLPAACGHHAAAPHAAIPAVPTVTARQGTVFPSSTMPGIIAPLQDDGITSSLSEPADAVYVKEGDLIHRGEVLALLDTADLRAELAADVATVKTNQAKQAQTYDQASLTIVQNSNTVNQARAMLRQYQVTLATDTVNLHRYAELIRHGYIPQVQYAAQVATVKEDQQNVRSARVTLQNDIQQVRSNGTTSTGLQGSQVQEAVGMTQMAQAQADQIRVMIAKATIVSPIDGVVVNRNLNPGEYPGTRQIFTLQETDRVYAILNGSAEAVVGIHAGDRVSVGSSVLRGRRFAGTVDGILNPIDPGSTNFIVKAILSNRRGILRPGMAVSAEAHIPPVTGLRIPATAFLDTTNSSVQTIVGNLVRTVHVTMIAQDTNNAIVTGLAPGTAVISNGQLGLADGQMVQSQPEVAQN